MADAYQYTVEVRTPPTTNLYCGVDCFYVACRSVQGVECPPLDTLEKESTIQSDGMSAAELVRLGDVYGLQIAALQLELDEIRRQQYSASILHVNSGHYVVLLPVDDGRLWRIFDPAIGVIRCDEEWFHSAYDWSGTALCFARGSPAFRQMLASPLITMIALLIWASAVARDRKLRKSATTLT